MIFKESALWADSFYKSKFPSVCPSVRTYASSFLRYRLNVFLRPLPKSGLRFKNFSNKGCKITAPKSLFLGKFWLTEQDFFWHWCYYPYRSRDSLSPRCGNICTRRYGPLRGPISSSCGGLRSSVETFFGLRAWKSFFMQFWNILGHFWCPVVSLVTFSSNLSNFENNPKKNI